MTTTNPSIEELKAMLETRKAEKRAEAVHALEYARINTQMTRLENPVLVQQEVIRERTQGNIKRLDALKSTFTELDAVKINGFEYKVNIYDADSRLGAEASKLVGILSAIDFSLEQHKTEMLSMTGLDADTVATTLDALGRKPRLDKKTKLITPSTTPDAELAKQQLEICAEILNLGDIKLNRITQETLNLMVESARIKAETEKANHERLVATMAELEDDAA